MIFGDRIRDMLSGYRVFSRRFVKSFPALARGFETETELTVHALELRMPIAEVDTPYRDRPAGSHEQAAHVPRRLPHPATIVFLVKEERPLLFFSAVGRRRWRSRARARLAAARDYLETGLVPRFPTAILATGLMSSRFMSFVAGLDPRYRDARPPRAEAAALPGAARSDERRATAARERARPGTLLMGPLTLLPLLGIALTVSRIARIPAATAFFFGVAFVILTLYAGALAGALWWTALAVHVAGVALLGLEALRHARQRAAVTIPVSAGVLALLCSWFWIVHGAGQYHIYDEYAHWGIFLKEMLALDGFWTAETSSMHPRYPPGAPLWQYLFSAFLPPSEGKAYFAQFVLLLAPLLMLWNAVRWSQPAWIGAILALVLLALTNLGLGVSSVLLDHVIGVWYLGTLVAAVADEDLASRRVVLYAAPLAVIALLKDAGLALAVSGAMIIAALYWHRALVPSARTGFRRAGAALAVLLAPTLLCVQVWSWNRDAVGAAPDVQSIDGFVGGIADGTSEANSERNAEIARRLNEVFFDQQLSNGPVSQSFNEFTYDIRHLFTDSYRLTTFAFLVAFMLWWVVIAWGGLTGESRRRWLIVASGVFVTALAYIASLHLSYRFSFGERGLELPSYVRYVNIIALPMLLLLFCPLLPAFRDRGQQRVWLVRGLAVPQRAALYAAAVLALYAFETSFLQPIMRPAPDYPLRAQLEPMLEEIRADVGMSRTWIYYTTDSEHGSIGRLVQFLLAPTPTAMEHSDRFLQNDDAASIAAAWRGFAFVWIASPLTPEAAAGLARFSGV